eukprot:CAMPEP_0172517264 /NCGR_PEP_ID=MMETSP1066-20121228/283455_1 /TAXON_ID=671091 /ORGANISM="Coscinodiscus wailesii, Strain CCMP2513" /LENGTH=311 /DNA_ID=CAMNT_0013299167 /DNA_START=47 /DNA_END=979 /DNA_ORIENTATION=+
MEKCIDKQCIETLPAVRNRRVIFPFIHDISRERQHAECVDPIKPCIRTHSSAETLSTVATAASADLSLQASGNDDDSSYGEEPIVSTSTCRHRTVKFDTHVRISNYELSDYEKSDERWYSGREMWIMKMEAFYHRSFSDVDNYDGEESIDDDHERELLRSSVKTILVVDSHPLFLLLLVKSLKTMIPLAKIFMARSGEEAWSIIKKTRLKGKNSGDKSNHGFDIIITKEKLTSVSVKKQCDIKRTSHITGSLLLKCIAMEQKKTTRVHQLAVAKDSKNTQSNPRHALLIVVSDNLDKDRETLKHCGADLIW